MSFQILSGTPHQMGAHHDGDGVNFAVFSAHADKIELCLFSEDGNTEVQRLVLPERTGDVWHGYVPDLPVGALYGFRAHGTYAPEQGHRFNANKLLLDPYTREVRGNFANHKAVLGYDKTATEADLSFSKTDSAPYVAKSVISAPSLFANNEPRLSRAWDETLIYEAHVKGLTQRHPEIPTAIRGTYEAMAADPILDHLQNLGVTAVELLPVHAFINDGFLLDKKLTNYLSLIHI